MPLGIFLRHFRPFDVIFQGDWAPISPLCPHPQPPVTATLPCRFRSQTTLDQASLQVLNPWEVGVPSTCEQQPGTTEGFLYCLSCEGTWHTEGWPGMNHDKENDEEEGIEDDFYYCCSVAKSCLTLLRPHRLQHTRLPCPSLSPGVCSNSCPLNRWCHPIISFSVTLFSFCLQSFPASGSFPKSLPIRWSKY